MGHEWRRVERRVWRTREEWSGEESLSAQKAWGEATERYEAILSRGERIRKKTQKNRIREGFQPSDHMVDGSGGAGEGSGAEGGRGIGKACSVREKKKKKKRSKKVDLTMRVFPRPGSLCRFD
jgi:hypothetical protein